MHLPENKNISVSKLNSVFRYKVATYKFYWFWAILECIEEDQNKISKKEIFARMLTLSWYTVNYFHVSFGKQDLIQDAIYKIKGLENIKVDAHKSEIFEKIIKSNNVDVFNILRHFNHNVPHKFLSPWLASGSKNEVYTKSRNQEFNCPYALYDDYIIINENWKNYFIQNLGILKSFICWHLSLFLQARNSNVPSIPNKIIKPVERNGLNKHKTEYWNIILKELGGINCIYTGKKLYEGDYAVEHFIPYQYVVHDMMWNLIPADNSFNSKKSDKLPSFEQYFDSFYNLQKEGFEIIQSYNKKNKFLEDYLPIFPDLKMEKSKYAEYIKPILTVAHNNGFQYLES